MCLENKGDTKCRKEVSEWPQAVVWVTLLQASDTEDLVTSNTTKYREGSEVREETARCCLGVTAANQHTREDAKKKNIKIHDLTRMMPYCSQG